MAALEEFIQDNVRLPSPPGIALRILEAVKAESSSYAGLARIISSDPALAARILKVANSSYYALPKKVDSIEKALTVLGVETLKNIALSFVIAKEMRGFAEGGFDFNLFWRRGVTAAVSAEMLGRSLGRRGDESFVSALLQDIGVVLLFLCRPEEYLRVLDGKRESGLPVQDLERQTFGFDHQDLGAEVLKRWGLPQSIYGPIAYHHRTAEAPEDLRPRAELLGLSDMVSSGYHGKNGSGKMNGIRELLTEKHGIGQEQATALIDAVAEKTLEVLTSFEIDPGTMKPYSQILQEANEELGRLNLSYEQLVMEYKQAKEQAERLAKELGEANGRLREMAFKDGLTGLFNHRYFQESMDRELGRALRYGRPLALVLFDIDHFKKVNDTYGHPAGDAVLRDLADLARKTVRSSDMVARYGGEEFAIILPETDRKGAGILADRLRQLIEGMTIEAGGKSIRVTISAGVAAYEPGAEGGEKSKLIGAADKALYNSKSSGRNRITVVQFNPAVSRN